MSNRPTDQPGEPTALEAAHSSHAVSFEPDELKQIALKHRARRGVEQLKRLTAARWIALLILPVTALAALYTLVTSEANAVPAWAPTTLASIVTAAIAFLFSDQSDRS